MLQNMKGKAESNENKLNRSKISVEADIRDDSLMYSDPIVKMKNLPSKLTPSIKKAKIDTFFPSEEANAADLEA